MRFKAASRVPIDDRRRILCDLVNKRRAEILAGGLMFGGHRYDTDPTSLQNLTATVAALSAGITLPDPFYWRSADNELVLHTSESIALLAAAALQFVNAAYSASWEKKDAIKIADEPELVEITTGWPES